MLRLINVCKSFKIGKEDILILDNINLDFKKSELVFILGKSGSGKSTLLNIIGGILNVSSGSVMIDDKDITKFSNNMLCNFRNNMIGFVFQDYNLIDYMSVVDNIKLGMTVKNNFNKNIYDILKKLDIYHKRKVRVDKLSGGERQRVAIARAIVNDPDIILADEPTGALDINNSIKIMNILKDLSKDKLVIVVSHDSMLANKYADRVINIVDGKIEYYPQMDNGKFKNIQQKKISFWRLCKLALKNLFLKKGKTILTSVTIAISFVSMLLVLCLSKSFNEEILELEKNIVSVFPISVYNGEFEVSDNDIISSKDKIIIKEKNKYIHTNRIDSDYLDFINNIEEINYISYQYDISMPIISDRYYMLNNSYMQMLPNVDFIYNNYDLLYGKNITSMNQILLKIDSNNNVSDELLNVFNINNDIEYSELVGRKFRVVLNDFYYEKNGDYYFINDNNEMLYKSSNIELEIVGIVREKEIVDDRSYFYYDNKLIDYIISNNSNSKIVMDQINSDHNVLGINTDKYELLSFLGYESLPIGVDIYVSSVENKSVVLGKLDNYNNNINKLIYVDKMNDAISIFKTFINIITIILVIFSMISIIVSCLMICMLTSNRVISRVKEIGILKSIGARNKDIVRLFNIENLVIGIISSIIGFIIIVNLDKPINYFLEMFLDGEGIFKIYLYLSIVTVLFNIFIVVISGYIPIKIASCKKITDCLNKRV